MIKLMPGLAAAGLVLSLMSTSVFAAPAGSDNTQRPAQIVRVAQMPKYVKPQFKRKKVRLVTTEAAGTVIIDTNNKYLYLVEGNNRATRYGIGVGRDGFGWSGIVKIGRKAEWPAWTPPAECAAVKPPKVTSFPLSRKAARTIRSAPAPCISIRAAATPFSASTAPTSPGRSASTCLPAASA
ncbi:lipoprotein-anchoring transpeptidase ErfK/SrfK [Rhizobium lentis]|uniref:Lipoprotein-anchoring transpeptidase ErfK/SrfK n=1 Tax=Rhizobium lentis TaxID=1138194 RepID=A0A7W9CX25_9HYPH|nr:lipoprotein-anchoring transpeptidase ErfK/SrfK [Rhizobium lentis]MBB5552367.1 lipoprotein-anchoring transpeptidase ErfK/SrfK [Rhizobium lentis]MBB5563024.1 lipoprotein-anchoring transpeptidase ErfK/SrfK [Rhizobium lentis]MBB5569184.1 lipoprotein-anchoring transpeptidase ErfK/SrfK [Rhizobium lentis]